MWFGVVTLFPEMFSSLMDYGVTARAVENKLIEIAFSNPRDFTTDRHQSVDDRPYGGGPGMVMKAQMLLQAVEHLKSIREKTSSKKVKVLYLSPVGTKLTQSKVRSLALESELILVAGRYEGIDQRFIDTEVNESISIGDYVVSGGELPAMVLMDAITRLQPGVLGHPHSCEQDSFGENQLLDYPHYTRPEVWQNRPVPEILLSGHHQNIERWRREEALKLTQRYRSDLLENEQENNINE